VNRRPRNELLDLDAGTPAEIAAAFRDLRWFNRWFGGLATTRELIATVVRKTGLAELTILDVASGDGFILERLRQEFESCGVGLRITLLDRAGSHLTNHRAGYNVVADALHLPFEDSSFDLVSSSLFVHHLSPRDVVSFADEALRVSRTAVLVHDLIRNPLHLALAYAGAPLYGSRITRNDAPASVWQAYTVDEMRNFFRQAHAAAVETEKHFLYRMGVIAWKRQLP
jgi:ubiquinone/menaquinone biosynthesis C-methylase UbiE